MDESASVVKVSAPLAESYPQQIPMAQPVSAMAVPSFGYNRSETFDPDQQIRVGEWEMGLWGCFTHLVPNCFMVVFCPCVSLAQISARLSVSSFGVILTVSLIVIAVEGAMIGLISNEVHKHEDSTNDDDLSWLYSSKDYGTAYRIYNGVICGTHMVVFLYVRNLRTKIRERFEIPGNAWKDICASVCCSCCAIAQMATHVKSYKPGTCSFGPPDTLPAYPHGTPVAAASSYV